MRQHDDEYQDEDDYGLSPDAESMIRFQQEIHKSAAIKIHCYKDLVAKNTNYVLLSPEGDVIFWSRVGGRSDYMSYAVAKARAVIDNGGDSSQLVDPVERWGPCLGPLLYNLVMIPYFWCCCGRFPFIGGQAVQIGASVGALGFHGGGDGAQGLSRDCEVCKFALEASGFHRIDSGVWVEPADAYFHHSLAMTDSSSGGKPEVVGGAEPSVKFAQS
mmetsp:Transcript_33661/g.68814  ORF Transcript_33661/g.68814 Transcript_33661/m.68814 type:complete len:216 (+) Transcript_33661:91-738(+)